MRKTNMYPHIVDLMYGFSCLQRIVRESSCAISFRRWEEIEERIDKHLAALQEMFDTYKTYEREI